MNQSNGDPDRHIVNEGSTGTEAGRRDGGWTGQVIAKGSPIEFAFLVDLDGDGHQDILTDNRCMAHNRHDLGRRGPRRSPIGP